MKLLWTYADKDPMYGQLKWYGTFSGVRSIHMLTPMWKKPNPNHNANSRDTRQWDVTVKNVSHTLFIFTFRCESVSVGKKVNKQHYDQSRACVCASGALGQHLKFSKFVRFPIPKRSSAPKPSVLHPQGFTPDTLIPPLPVASLGLDLYMCFAESMQLKCFY